MSENTSAAEWLRGIAQRKCNCHEVVRMFGFACGESPCTECIPRLVGAIAQRVEEERALPDGVEWPRFEDGEPVKAGDEVAIAYGLHVHNFLIWMNRASSWAHRSPDYSDDDSSPEETQNTPSDGVAAPSNEALGALTRRMDETNALLRAVSHQIAALVSIGTCELTKSTCDYPKEVVNMTLGMASDCLRASKVCFESAEKENQDGKA